MGGETLFFDYKCNFDRPESEEIVLCSDWCPREFKKPLLVVGSSDGTLNLFHDEGERLENAIKRQHPPTCCAWGPAPHYLLATGWDDGAVSLWNVATDEKSKLIKEDKAVHSKSICLVTWSPNGDRLVSSDLDGVVGVWKPDDKGRLVSICKIRKGRAAVTHVAFRTHDSRSPAGLGGAEAPNFYFSGEDGIIYLAGDDASRCKEVLRMEGPDGAPSGTAVLNYFPEKDQIVGVNDHLIMTRAAGPDDSGQVSVVTSAKLSARSEDRMLALWAAPGLLATSSGERMVRLWNLVEDDNYVLQIEDPKVPPDDKITSISYSESKRVLCAGTKKGYILFWFFAGGSAGGQTGADDWQAQPHATAKLDAEVSDLKWAHSQGVLSVSTDASCSILIEHVLRRQVRDGVALVQISNRVLGFASTERQLDDQGVPDMDMESQETASFWAGDADAALGEITASIPIKGCDNTKTKIVVWSGRKAEVYEINAETLSSTLMSSFETAATNMAIGSDETNEAVYLYMAVETRIAVANLQGVVTKTLTVGETEGVPICMEVSGGFLAVSTARNIIRMWDIRTREHKTIGAPRKFEEGDRSLGEITALKANREGGRIAILAKHADRSVGHGMNQMSVYVYDVETDSFMSYDCGPRHYPVACGWDRSDPRLLGCETRQLIEVKTEVGEIHQKIARAEIVTFFVTPDKGLMLQDRFSLQDDVKGLLGLTVPHIFLCSHEGSAGPIKLRARLMRDFVGMSEVNSETRKALLEFSFHLTNGNMDEAYRAVKLIKSKGVWENMAHMCVKTQRLDVAEVCLSNMGNARGAMAVRQAKKEPEPEASIAMVAIQLGLIEDAERLYLQCGRYDLLNQMYQATGDWDKAVDVARKKDRIHLRTTYFNMAKDSERSMDIPQALSNYEKADAHRVEVPRMLHQLREMSKLEQYVKHKNDSKLSTWWAQSLESNGKLDQAAFYYQSASDWLSLVRICCFKQAWQKAEEVVNDAVAAHPDAPETVSAAFFLASQLEALGKPKATEAIQMYAKAGRYYHCVRLAKEYELDKELLPLALQAPRKVQIDTARYFEGKRMFDQAVQLYQKGGDSTRALELCFSAKLFDSLRSIADDLGETTDPALLAKVGDFFTSHAQYDKAAQLFITGKQVKKAMDMCEQHNVAMTEEMSEKLTALLPSKEEDEAGRNTVLRRIAELCVKQGNYHLATKRFTQAGMKDKAMDALLKSGDTEKIIFFAGVLRSKEIYTRAANYLQTLSWHTDADIMKKIIEFYTKAKAYQQLSHFYDACSQVEIDEYRDYEKALGALKESRKFMVKAEKPTSMLDTRIRMIETFVQAKTLVKSDPDHFLKMCYSLVDEAVDDAVRVGDVYAILVEYFYSIGDQQKAYNHIVKMRQRRIILGPYLDDGMVSDIYRACGVQEEQNDDDGVDEDIADDM